MLTGALLSYSCVLHKLVTPSFLTPEVGIVVQSDTLGFLVQYKETAKLGFLIWTFGRGCCTKGVAKNGAI